MSGFGRVAFEGEFYNQSIVNVFWYRSTAWLPNQGNPFDDVLAFVDAVIAELKADFLACLPTDYTLRKAVGVGYDDAFEIVTASPLVRTIDESGDIGATLGMGAAQCAIVGLRQGEQVQISGIGKSARNRGYLAVGPLLEAQVDQYSHLVPAMTSALGNFAEHLDNGITVVAPAVTLTPIRIHQKYVTVLGVRQLLWRTYSDVKGYSINPVASYRRSRQPEA